MKNVYLYLIISLLFFGFSSKGQSLSQADSIIYFLEQVKGLQSNDSVLIMKAVDAIFQATPDSLPVDRIDDTLEKLAPVITRQNCLAVKTAVCIALTASSRHEMTIDYSRGIIDELKNYSGGFERNLLVYMIIASRFPYRNSNRINEGVEYYQRIANDLEQTGDSIATSYCYSAMAGFYRTLSLLDKAVYCELKSLNFLNRNQKLKANYFPFQGSDDSGLLLIINREAFLAGMLIDYEKVQRALPYLYEAKALFESIKDSVLVYDGPYIYLQIIRAKIMTGGDSVDYYLNKMESMLDTIDMESYWSIYYQTLGYYLYLQDRLDSAESQIRLSAEYKKTYGLLTNSFCGNIIPGYYLALINMKRQNYADAINLLKDEINELLEVNLRDIVLKEWLLLSDAYKMSGDPGKSATTLEQYIALQKQILEDADNSRSMSFETELQINELNADKQKQQHEIKRQKLIRNGIAGGLVIVLLFLLIVIIQRNRISKEKKRSEGLLLNILPYETAKELKEKGKSDAKMFDEVTVMFTDFKDFTRISESLTPSELVAEIDYCFKAFDTIVTKHNIEKIKTIGDSYMCAGGLPVPNKTNATDVVKAAVEIRDFMMNRNSNEGKSKFEIRIGINTGAVVAGIVGIKKFAYDIWGDTVNIASRMESSGEAGKVNISISTYELVKDEFACTYRGKIVAKNKGEIDMYFIENKQ